MRIGLCGAHRSGKTTLAIALAEKLDLTPVLSGTSQIVADHGFSMAADNRLDHANGMQMQDAIVEALLDREIGDRFIADRVPIDAAAYTLADASAGAGDPIIYERVLCYVDRAIRETFRRFDLLILVPPALPVEVAEGKPPINPAYQTHHHLLCRGMLFDSDYLTTVAELPIEVLDLKARVQFVEAHIRDAARNRRIRLGCGTTKII